MLNGVWTSDTHLGLQTDEIDRTEEIFEVLSYIFKYAKKKKADFVVLGGDLFDHNTPGEELIAVLITLLNKLKGIPVFVMVGNHDVVASHKRKSCLSFIDKLKDGYPNVTLIDKPKLIKFKKAEVGDIYFSFLPFIAKSHLPKGYKSTQQYVDHWAKDALKKIPWNAQHYCFSHLNVPNSIPGSEENMLKKVELMLPKCFLVFKPKRPLPIIIQGHHHSRQVIGNINIVGSPIFVGYGEKEANKYFLHLKIAEDMIEGSSSLKYKKTPCRNFLEFEFEPFEVGNDHKLIKDITKTIKKSARKSKVDLKNSIVKINLILNEKTASFNYRLLEKTLSKICFHIKPITPRYLRSRIKRNKKQVIKLTPSKAVKVWLKSNKPKNKEAIEKLADKYISGRYENT